VLTLLHFDEANQLGLWVRR